MRSFVIWRHAELGAKKPVLQGWGYKKSAEAALRGIQRAYKSQTFSLEF